MTNEERAAIIAQTRANLDPVKRQEDQDELVRRLMEQPLPDPVAKWRSEAAELEARRAAFKRRTYAATDAERAAGWETWVRSQLHEQKEFLIEVVGNALGTCVEQLRDDLFKKVDELERHFKAMKTLYDRELALANSHIKLLQRQLDQLTTKRHGGNGLATSHDDLRKYDA